MRHRPLVLAVTLLAAVALRAPAHADDAEYAGPTCGLLTTNDVTGVVTANYETQDGVMWGGPWAAADLVDDSSIGASHDAIADITMHCWVQTEETPQHPGLAHCDFTGTGVAAGACQVAYTVAAGSPVYYCTWVEMTHNGTTENHGPQCKRALDVVEGHERLEVGLPDLATNLVGGDTETPLVPQSVLDAVDTARDLGDAVAATLADAAESLVLKPFADPIACPILASLTPGVPGIVDIDPTGDTSLFGTVVRDCPPYTA